MDSTVEYLRTKLTERWITEPSNPFSLGNNTLGDNNNVILTGLSQYQDVIDSVKTIK